MVCALGTVRSRRSVVAGLLAAAAIVVLASPARAQERGFYVGVPVMAERLAVRYDKAVDNTDPRNVSPSSGRVFRANASDTGTAGGVGFLAGYRAPFGSRGVYLSGEFDLAVHGGAIQGRLEGAGFSAERTQLGENWPEDWAFEKQRSYGFTIRFGTRVPPGGGLRLYGLAGVRRLDARFGVDYIGCFNFSLCAAPEEFVPVTDNYEESFSGWMAGAGVEQRLRAGAALRGELRYSSYGRAERVIPYNDLAIRVPLALEASGVGVQVSLVWYF